MSEYPGSEEDYATTEAPEVELEYSEPAYEEIPPEPEPEPEPEPTPEPEPEAEAVPEPEPEPEPEAEAVAEPQAEEGLEPQAIEEYEPAEEEPEPEAEAIEEHEPAEDEPEPESAEDYQEPVLAPEAEEPNTFETDPSQWSQPGLPEDWETWAPAAEPDPATFTEEVYSTDWGTVEPAWAAEGEQPFPVSMPEVALTDVVGPGHALDIYWGDQGQTQYCALFSAGAIIAEHFGEQVNVEDIAARAKANDWLALDDAGNVLGTQGDKIDDLLASYGIASHYVSGMDEASAWQYLNDALANNQRVVVGVHGAEIDAGQNVGDVAGALDADHAVVITGIDYERGVAIVNDSARSAGLEIPLTVFIESWRDSAFEMTITDAAAPEVVGANPPAGHTRPDEDTPGFAVLPMTLHPTISAPPTA